MKNLYKASVLFSLIWIVVLGSISTINSRLILNKIYDLEDNYINRFEPLIKDSLKMHRWYENWEYTYQEKNTLLLMKE